jgi:CMP-N-acetylneuraminic acid synthetase
MRLLRDDLDTTSTKLPIREIMLHAGNFHTQSLGACPDVVAFLSIHAVHRRAEHLEKAINVMRINESDSVVSVQEEKEPMFSHGSDGLDLLNPGRFHDLTYERERLYAFNGAVLASWWEVLKQGSLLGQKIGYIEMSPNDSLQIKTPAMLRRPA